MKNSVGATTAELARFSELIDCIYQGATDPNHWNKVLSQVADWVGAPKGVLFTPLNSYENGGYYFGHNTPASMMELVGTRYQQHDIWAIRSVQLGLMYDGNVINGDDIVPFEEYSSSVMYQELLSKYDVVHMLGGVVFGASNPQIPASGLALHRGLKEGRFHSHEAERLGLLMPHLSRSIGVMVRLRDLEFRVASTLSALDNLTVGVLLFNAQEMVCFANHAAQRILEDEDGLKLHHHINDSSLGKLVADNGKANIALLAAIRAAIAPDIMGTEHFSKAVAVFRPSGRQDYLLNFSSLATQNEFATGPDRPCAIAFITDNAEPIKLDAELMKKTYGLTPAEIRLTEVIAEGLTVEDAAERIGVSSHTARSQLKSIYSKTNTNNRARLMRLIMSLTQIQN